MGGRRACWTPSSLAGSGHRREPLRAVIALRCRTPGRGAAARPARALLAALLAPTQAGLVAPGATLAAPRASEESVRRRNYGPFCGCGGHRRAHARRGRVRGGGDGARRGRGGGVGAAAVEPSARRRRRVGRADGERRAGGGGGRLGAQVLPAAAAREVRRRLGGAARRRRRRRRRPPTPRAATPPTPTPRRRGRRTWARWRWTPTGRRARSGWRG